MPPHASSKAIKAISARSRESLRLEVVKAVTNGMSQAEAARQFGVTRASVNAWMAKFRAAGPKTLADKKVGRPRGTHVAQDDMEELTRRVSSQRPTSFELPYQLWNKHALREILASRLTKSVSPRTIDSYFKRLGFHQAHAPERSLALVEAQHPEFRAARAEGRRLLLWLYDLPLWRHENSEPGLASGMVTVWSSRGLESFWGYQGKTLDAATFVELLERLELQAARRASDLLMARHGVHDTKEVRRWLQASAKIRLWPYQDSSRSHTAATAYRS